MTVLCEQSLAPFPSTLSSDSRKMNTLLTTLFTLFTFLPFNVVHASLLPGGPDGKIYGVNLGEFITLSTLHRSYFFKDPGLSWR